MGDGKWEQVSWDEALDDIAGRIRKAIIDGRTDEVVYHVGRPGEDGFAERMLQAWGVDGHNSHTNVCSSGARLGMTLWAGYDRPSPDHANAKVILLLSSHLETGHYFNPHAQRIMEGKQGGAKLVVVDPRMSNTASHADVWMAPWPGSEAAILSGHRLLPAAHPLDRRAVHAPLVQLGDLSRAAPPEFAADVRGVSGRARGRLRLLHLRVRRRGGPDSGRAHRGDRHARRQLRPPLAAHVWRSAAAGNLGGWQVARALWFVLGLTGSIGTVGGTNPNGWAKFIPHGPDVPPHDGLERARLAARVPVDLQRDVNPAAALPQRGPGPARGVLLPRVQPDLDLPDGFTWMRALSDEDKVGLHVALTPTWSETAEFADLILPVGHATERHDTHSYETHAAKWLGFRQPVRRVAMERLGSRSAIPATANPGEVWEENELWFELSWRIDPDGSLGIRRHFESHDRPGRKGHRRRVLRWIFENQVPGLPEKAAAEGMTPLEYMRRYGVVEVATDVYRQDERPLTAGRTRRGRVRTRRACCANRPPTTRCRH